jgi:hypothetical protein
MGDDTAANLFVQLKHGFTLKKPLSGLLDWGPVWSNNL